MQLWACVQSYADAYYVLTKRGGAPKAVKEALLATLDVFEPCNTYASALKPALLSDWNDLEDYLIAYSSKNIAAEYLITRDREMTELSPIPAISARELLQRLEDEQGLVYDEITF